jgi:DNA-binding SARP family transcriptional activator
MLADFRILGPLEVVDVEGHRLDLGAPRQRAVLAALLVHLNEVVSIDRLIDELWGDTPPGAATTSLQAYVSNLRRVLEPDRAPRTPAAILVTEAPGYVLRVAPEQVDAYRFERLAADAHRALGAGDGAGALATLDRALGLWRGEPLGDFSYEAFAGPEISRLNELRAAAEEDRVEALLVVGDQTGALAAVRPLVVRHPLREGLRALQMRALYDAGRQAEALRAYDDTRRVLADELGVEPGPALQRLHRQVLDHDLSRPVDAGARTPETASEPSRRARSPTAAPRPVLLGRDAPLAALRRALTEAEHGRTRMVLIEGEPGIGKTPRLGAPRLRN